MSSVSSAVSLNNRELHVAGTAILDSPTLLRFYNPVDVPLPGALRGYVQLRRYEPRAPTHQPFQLFNVYLPTGPGKHAEQEKCIRLMSMADASVDTFVCGD